MTKRLPHFDGRAVGPHSPSPLPAPVMRAEAVSPLGNLHCEGRSGPSAAKNQANDNHLVIANPNQLIREDGGGPIPAASSNPTSCRSHTCGTARRAGCSTVPRYESAGGEVPDRPDAAPAGAIIPPSPLATAAAPREPAENRVQRGGCNHHSRVKARSSKAPRRPSGASPGSGSTRRGAALIVVDADGQPTSPSDLAESLAAALGGTDASVQETRAHNLRQSRTQRQRRARSDNRRGDGAAANVLPAVAAGTEERGIHHV